MAKNIALFSDGTGNSSAKLAKTNVWRIYQALDLTHPDQIAYYDNGVGTSSFKPWAILGGALGFGLKRNVKHLYAYLSRNYNKDDQIYAFGFSRGAFTIRMLVGLVYDQGLAKGATEAELWRDVHAKWRAFRRKARTRIAGAVRTKVFGRRAERMAEQHVKFTFLGLWDTVDAYGLPVDELTRAWDYYVWPLSFDDRFPCDNIEKAFHALAIDDERNTFHPVLWTEENEKQNETSARLDQERISQVWFAGVHCNVGGGYPEDSLAHVPLLWIMNEAADRKLRFQPDERKRLNDAASPHGPIFNSRGGAGGYYRYNPRRIDKLIKDDFHKIDIKRPKIHESVFMRMAAGTDRYAPIILPEKYAVVKADGSITDNLFESPDQAKARASDQERVWNWVWARRVNYFFALFVTFILAFFPLRLGDGACKSDYFCFLTPVINAAAALLPGFANPWINTFKANPGWFLLAAGLILACLSIGGRLNRRIRDTMRLVWELIIAGRQTPGRKLSGLAHSVYWLRTRKSYQWLFRWLTRGFLPFVFAMNIYYWTPALASRVIFSVFNAAGFSCAETENNKQRPVGNTFVEYSFDSEDVCKPSGYKLQKDARYRIWIAVDKDRVGKDWMDNTIPAGVDGLSRDKVTAPMYAFVPYRRWLSEPWFKPIARIGKRGNDEYPLEPTVPFTEDDTKRLLATEIVARRDGELFLYVNDAVFLWPWLHTYGNNTGSATVKIERVEALPMPQ